MPSPDETQILGIIAEEGGETSGWTVAGKMKPFPRKWNADIESLCESLARRDYIDLFPGVKVSLVEKGWRAIGKKPPKRKKRKKKK